jgi:hypothetical protein
MKNYETEVSQRKSEEANKGKNYEIEVDAARAYISVKPGTRHSGKSVILRHIVS